MLALYRSLLYLYPAAYRREYGEEMMEVLSEVQAEKRNRNRLIQFLTGAHEAGGLLCGALGGAFPERYGYVLRRDIFTDVFIEEVGDAI